MKVAIGSDEAGFILKENLKSFLLEQSFDVTDYGVYDKSPSLYPETAKKVGVAIKNNKHKRGILICGTGIGMAISANKIPGVRAAQCHDTYSAQRAKNSNDAQIITLGARVIGLELAKVIVLSFLNSKGIKESSKIKIDKINEIEKTYSK